MEEKILKLLFNLSATEICCLKKIYSKKQLTLKELSLALKKDTSHISRCAKKLFSYGLVEREAKCCAQGKKGRYWVYKSLKKSELKKLLRRRAQEIYREAIKNIRKM